MAQRYVISWSRLSRRSLSNPLPTFQIDVKNLRNLFAQLQFKVEHKKNLKRHEFDRELLAFANDPGHRESDMMILAILSHGREGNVFASDGTVIAIESIYEKFNNKNCPALQGKPKFFIIQVGGLKSMENVVKYAWSMQSVNPAVQNVGPVGWC